MPRVRRPRRQAPVLELLEATLPELRRGLTESAARTVAYELFEKLGFGAVAVTDTHRVLAFVGAGADHHGCGRPADPAGLRSARTAAPAARAARDPHRVRAPGLPARRRRRRPAAADRRPGGRGRRLRDGGIAARRDGRRDPRAARHPALRAAAAVGAPLRDDHRVAGADGAAFRLQRAEHDRVVHPHRAGTRATARARLRRPSPQPSRAAGRVHHARGRATARAAATSSSSRRGSARSSR